MSGLWSVNCSPEVSGKTTIFRSNRQYGSVLVEIAMLVDRIPMTREGYEKLKAELAQLDVAMIEVTKRVATAREMGDLSENAEYHAAREDQGILQARINDLSDRIARAAIVDPSSLPKGTVVFGSKVR